MNIQSSLLMHENNFHWLVIPMFGDIHPSLPLFDSLEVWLSQGFRAVIVNNNPGFDARITKLPGIDDTNGCHLIFNGNRGGIAGGLNRGVSFAIAAGAKTITLLDQDSSLDPLSLTRLREPLQRYPSVRLVVGPRIWDQRRSTWHDPPAQHWHEFLQTRLLISSGTTFLTTHWPSLGCFDEQLFIDFVDHAWCFRAQAYGFLLIQHPNACLEQQFGQLHPSRFCRWLGLELYQPERHYTSLRNLRWLVRQWWVPSDLRLKEALKMLFKPWLWLLFEPQRRANAKAIVAALLAPLPLANGVERSMTPQRLVGRS